MLFVLILLNLFLNTKSFGAEQFFFDVKELEITEEGNLIKGLNRGIITTNDEIIIISDSFTYNKYKNILVADGNVQIEDTKRKIKLFSNNLIYKTVTQNFTSTGNVRFIDKDKNVKIYAEQAVYEKSNEIIKTDTNSKAIFEDNQTIIGDKFKYQITENIFTSTGNVRFIDKDKNVKIYAEQAVYEKSNEIIKTDTNSKAIFEDNQTIIGDKFKYQITENIFTSTGNVRFIDKDKNVKIYAEQAVYEKSNEIIKTDTNSKAIFEDNQTIIGDKFKYQITENIFTSTGNVVIEDKTKTIINSQEVKYFKLINKIITKGNTTRCSI